MIILRPHMEIRLYRIVRGVLMVASAWLLMLWCQACKKPERKPEEVLSTEKMQEILRDIYIVEDKITRLQVGVDSSAQLMDIFKEKVLEKHQVSDSLFTISYDYYVDHPKDLELIYSALVDSLQLEEERSRSVK